MKLLQLNMWGGRLNRQVLDLVQKTKPDILCLQEAIDLTGGNAGMFISVDEICEAIDAPYIFMTPTFSFNYMHRKANFGNCIISKYKFLEQEAIFTGLKYIEDFDWSQHSSNIRNLQKVTIEMPSGGKLAVFNHHGHHIPEHKNGDEESLRQCSIIAKNIKKTNGAVVLAGDFNLAPSSKSLKLINDILSNLSIEHKLATTRTSMTFKTEVCDYIFVNDKVKVNSFGALDDVASDHKALLLEFDLV